MKRRRSLLFGLGILVTLSMAVPVSAAETNSPVSVTELGNGEDTLSNTEKETDGQEVEAEAPEEKAAEITWVWTKEADGRWKLTDGKDSADAVVAAAGVYTVDGGVFCVDKDGYLVTGVQMIETKEGCPITENGKYYFAENGTNPNKDGDGFGKLVAADQWVNTKDNKWLKLNESGKVDETKVAWQQLVAGKWYFLNADGSRDTGKTGMQTIGNATYFLNADGVPQKGFQKVGGQTYYFDASTGVRQNYTGWKVIEGKLYYFNSANQLANSGVIGWQNIAGNWYWFENGNAATGWRYIGGRWFYMDESTAVMKTGLFTDASGNKYYCDGSGAMVGGGWNYIDGNWYWMHGNGVIATGWVCPDGATWYYMNSDGKMATGWYKVDGSTFYSNGSGMMLTGWQYINGVWYYFAGNGMMQTGWQYLNGAWYYLGGNGAMYTGWYQVNGSWFFSNGSGAMQTGWQKINGAWYYFAGNGAMQTGWYNLGGTWYYSNESGMMLTGWQQLGGKWYYLRGSGAMAANTWVDGYYYVNGSGVMVTNTWIDSYYVGADGRWIPNYDPLVDGGDWVKSGGKWYFKCKDGSYLKNRWQKLNGQWYYFEADGSIATGWRYLEGYKYYFNANGQMVQDLDSVIGRQSSYYITVNRRKCQVTVYANDGANGYIIPVKTFACSVGMPNTPTPVGTFKTPQKLRWHTLMGPSYGQYCTRIVGGILFHSVAGSNMTSYNLSAAEYNKLGSPASHGCVRLTVRDAKWIYDNCDLGTTVTISDTVATPFDKPVTPKIPGSQNWDPTDPNVK